jgi:hypothetical protein
VEEYIRDLEDGDMLMDMMSANAGYERTTQKHGENIFPEVHPPQTKPDNSTILRPEYNPGFNPKHSIPAS